MDASADDARDLTDDLSDIFGETVCVDRVEQKELGDAKLAVLQMRYTRVSTSDGHSHTTHVAQTAVVLDDQQLDLPLFQLSPTMAGMMGFLTSLVGDMGDINFPDSPDFSSSYHLHAWNENAARVLFTPALREFFGDNEGWSVRGSKSRLVIFKHNQICPPARLDAFIEHTLGALALFQQGEEALDARPDIRRDTRPEDVSATADRMTGLVGVMMQKQLKRIAVNREELESFLKEPIPRSAPAGMKRQVVGENIPLVIIGLMFLIAGIMVPILVLSLGEGYQKLFALPVTLFAVAGGCIVFFTLRHRGRKKRVLRVGEVCQGKITDIKETRTEINGQQQHHVVFEYAHDKAKKTSKANVYGMGVEQARAFLLSGNKVRVLVDPQDPDHVVCADLLLIFD